MGLLVNGEWVDQWYESSSKGEFVRQDSQFRSWITADGSSGPAGGDGFKAEAGRYHLYISLACPWAHRTLIFAFGMEIRILLNRQDMSGLDKVAIYQQNVSYGEKPLEFYVLEI